MSGMLPRRLSVVLLLLFLPIQTMSSQAMSLQATDNSPVDCAKAITTPEINHCASLELEEVERSLKQAYQKLVKQLSQPDTEHENYTDLRQSLQKAQQAWVKFREADCDTQFLVYGTGTIRTAVYLGCMRERALQRTKELENYIPY